SGPLFVLLGWVWYWLVLRLRGYELSARRSNAQDDAALLRVEVCWQAAHGLAMVDIAMSRLFHMRSARLALNFGDLARAGRALCGHAILVSVGGERAAKSAAQLITAARKLRTQMLGTYVDAAADTADGLSAFMIEKWSRAKTSLAKVEIGFRDRCVGA